MKKLNTPCSKSCKRILTNGASSGLEVDSSSEVGYTISSNRRLYWWLLKLAPIRALRTSGRIRACPAKPIGLVATQKKKGIGMDKSTMHLSSLSHCEVLSAICTLREKKVIQGLAFLLSMKHDLMGALTAVTISQPARISRAEVHQITG